MANSERCPVDPEETAEAYLLANLATGEARAFEEHYITCSSCTAILEETGRYVLAMNQVAQRLRTLAIALLSGYTRYLTLAFAATI
jgi:hypothetical protein